MCGWVAALAVLGITHLIQTGCWVRDARTRHQAQEAAAAQSHRTLGARYLEAGLMVSPSIRLLDYV